MGVEAGAIHFIIPDTQIEPGDPADHLDWAGLYLVEQFATKEHVNVIHLGDHAAMRSLSVHDSPEDAEGRTYDADIAAANEAWARLNAPLEKYNKHRRKLKERQWWPESRHILLGNHEAFIPRHVGQNPKLRGTLSLDDLDYARSGWEVHPYLDIVNLHGIAYSHCFVSSGNGRVITGLIENRIRMIGCSFVQGHAQGLKTGMVETIAGRRRGIVAGSYYCKAESYRTIQCAGEWRGLLILHEVRDGDYCLMEVSIDWLCRKYTGMPIAQFLQEKYGLDWAA